MKRITDQDHYVTPETVLWFGKYEGEEARDVPSEYLLWAHDEVSGFELEQKFEEDLAEMLYKEAEKKAWAKAYNNE